MEKQNKTNWNQILRAFIWMGLMVVISLNINKFDGLDWLTPFLISMLGLFYSRDRI